MASAFKLGGEEFLHDGRSGGGIDEASRHDEHVGVVVLADEVCYLGYPAQAGAYALVLVECHGDTLSATADGDAGVALALLYGFSQGVCIVGIVATGGAVGAEVLVLPAFGFEPLLELLGKFAVYHNY